MKQRTMIWAILAGFLGLVLFSAMTAQADDDKLPKPKKLAQVQKKIKAIQKEMKLVEKGKHEAIKKQTEACDALGEEVDAAEEEWKKTAEKLDEKTRKELLEKVKADPGKRISEYMSTPDGMSKSDFFICVGAAKKWVELQKRYEKMDEELVNQMKKVLDGLEKKLAKPQEEIADLLADYQEAVLLDALSSCKSYKDKNATFPVEELAKHVGDLQKTYQDDFGWNEDDLWKALEDAWTTARPCLPKAEREKASTKKATKTGKGEKAGKTGKAEKNERSASRRGSRRGKELQAGDRMVKNIRGVEFAFRWGPPGKFTMGGPRGEWDGTKWVDKNDQHEVVLTQGFWMLETEVTQAMWFLVMGNNPSTFKETNRPVETVSWDDCQEFCRRLSSALNMNIHLPSEAQWEYACRAGTVTLYYWGNDGGASGQYGNTSNDGHNETTPVRSYKPNAWGLYDMVGNVQEWCQDWFGDYPRGTITNPIGPTSGGRRIYRGGRWNLDVVRGQSAARDGFTTNRRTFHVGFRIVGTSK